MWWLRQGLLMLSLLQLLLLSLLQLLLLSLLQLLLLNLLLLMLSLLLLSQLLAQWSIRYIHRGLHLLQEKAKIGLHQIWLHLSYHITTSVHIH
jgi:hypothetical protein